MRYGYRGKILNVDLAKGTIAEEQLDDQLYKDFLGGPGLGARLLFSRQKGKVNALGPDNMLGFLTGVFTGTQVPYGGRYTVVAKSPLTGCWGDCNSGGRFGPTLKFAGLDAVFFTGVSEKPVYLFIDNGKAELRDASHLWGLDTFQTEDVLKAELGHDIEAACIGPAGEKLALIAAVMNNKGRAAARSGMGAVMGSKKLKAVAVRGNQKLPVAEPERLLELRRLAIEKGKSDPFTGKLFTMHAKFGNIGLIRSWIRQGAIPTKNYGGCDQLDMPDVDEAIGAHRVIAYQDHRDGCWGCPCICGGRMKAGTGEYKWEAGAHKPEYESMAFGFKCQNRNVESVIKACDITNRAGLDHSSASATISFAIECYENGLIGPKDTGGIELTWGNHRSIVKIAELMGNREGFGDVLADGQRAAAKKIGKGADEFVMDCGGQEIDSSDPRPWPGWATGYVIDATPGRHTVGSTYFAESPPEPPKGLGLAYMTPHVYTGKGEGNRRLQALHNIQNCTGICQFSAYHGIVDGENLPDFFKAVCGWNLNMDDIFLIADRIATIRMACTLREGINPIEDFRLPGRMLGHPPIKCGPHRGVSIDLDMMVREYLDTMGWDRGTFKPSLKSLEKVGLLDVAEPLGIK